MAIRSMTCEDCGRRTRPCPKCKRDILLLRVVDEGQGNRPAPAEAYCPACGHGEMPDEDRYCYCG